MRPARQIADIVYEVYEKPLDPVEFERRLSEVLANAEEKEEIAKLITWFSQRYPTTEARLRYARKHTPRRRG